MVDINNLKMEDSLPLFISFTGTTYNVVPVIRKYVSNDSMAIQLFSWDDEYKFWEPFDTLTTNLEGYSDMCSPHCAFIKYAPGDFGDYTDFILDNKIGTFTGRFGCSGFNTYREVLFTEEFVDKYMEKDTQ